jgi:hypothetical protein
MDNFFIIFALCKKRKEKKREKGKGKKGRVKMSKKKIIL